MFGVNGAGSVWPDQLGLVLFRRQSVHVVGVNALGDCLVGTTRGGGIAGGWWVSRSVGLYPPLRDSGPVSPPSFPLLHCGRISTVPTWHDCYSKGRLRIASTPFSVLRCVQKNFNHFRMIWTEPSQLDTDNVAAFRRGHTRSFLKS